MSELYLRYEELDVILRALAAWSPDDDIDHMRAEVAKDKIQKEMGRRS